MFDPEALGLELLEAAEAAAPVPLLTDRFPCLTWEEARAVACATDDIRRQRGETPIGFKLGWTSGAMRTALGIDCPNWGTLWDSHRCDGVLDLGSFIHPKVEPELVFRAARGLRGAASADEVAAAGSWALGLEVVDPRFPSFDFEALDNTADNSSAAAVIVGGFGDVESADLERLAIEFSDGSEVRHGVGANAMESPLTAVSWLVSQLDAEGSFLSEGDIVFTGGLTAPYDVCAGAAYDLVADQLGSVRLTVR